MSRHEAILVGVIVVTIILSCTFYGYQGHLCRLEAIKSGMKGEEVVKACR